MRESVVARGSSAGGVAGRGVDFGDVAEGGIEEDVEGRKGGDGDGEEYVDDVPFHEDAPFVCSQDGETGSPFDEARLMDLHVGSGCFCFWMTCRMIDPKHDTNPTAKRNASLSFLLKSICIRHRITIGTVRRMKSIAV